MDLLETMNAYRREASWAVWEVDAAGDLTGAPSFPLEQARAAAHGRAMIVSLNPGSDGAGEEAQTHPDWTNFHSLDAKHNDIFLGEAFVGTPYWGSYMTDLHPDIPESDSSLIRSKPPETELKVRSLIRQAHLLGSVESIICVGGKSHESVMKHAGLIESEIGVAASAIVRIPHYSRSNGRVHGRNAARYRELVRQAVGLG